MAFGKNFAKSATHGAGSLMHGVAHLAGPGSVHATQTVIVGRSVEAVQAAFRSAGFLTQVAAHLARVEEPTPGEFICTFAPAGTAEIVVATRLEAEPGALRWTSVESGDQTPQAATVLLVSADDPAHTRVSAEFVLQSHTAVPSKVSNLVLATAMREALHRAKAIIEAAPE